MINKMHIEMMPWRGFDFGDPIAEMFARMFAFLRIVLTLGKTQLSGLSLALEPKTITYDNDSTLETYGYNPRSEVTSANTPTRNQSFSYDNIGNRISASLNADTTFYTTNNLNQYQGQQFAYDFDGNQTTITTSAGTFAVEYNGENRPVKFTNLADSTYIRMRYDYMGRRAVKLCYNANGQWLSTAKFFYKDYTLIEESNASNIVQKEFVWDPTAGAATRPLYMRAPQKGTNLIYFHDANKNVSELHFLHIPNGIAAHYEYDAFGNVTKSTRNTTVTGTDYRTFNPFQFSSEYFDAELGLIYYNYRYYNPSSGRFLSRDPIAESGGFNLYATCRNNTNNYDLLGLSDQNYFPANLSCDLSNLGKRRIRFKRISFMRANAQHNDNVIKIAESINRDLSVIGFISAINVSPSLFKTMFATSLLEGLNSASMGSSIMEKASNLTLKIAQLEGVRADVFYQVEKCACFSILGIFPIYFWSDKEEVEYNVQIRKNGKLNSTKFSEGSNRNTNYKFEDTLKLNELTPKILQNILSTTWESAKKEIEGES